jgi:hypothetical protein
MLGVLTSVYSYAVDIYMADLQVFKGSEQSAENLIQKSSFSSLLSYELSRIPSSELTYKNIKKFSLSTKRVLKSEYIASKIDALVVCHFEKIDYLVFGTLLIDPATKNYSTSIKLYSLEKNEVIHEINLKKMVTNEEDYIKELSSLIDRDFNKLLAADIIKKPEVIAAAVIEETENKTPDQIKEPEQEDKTSDANKAAAVVTPADEEKHTEDTEDIKDTEDAKPLSAVLAKFIKKKEEEKQEAAADQEKKPAEKLFGIFTSLGYFVPFSGEWTSHILACVSLEEGLKYHFYLVNTEGFDFLLRPAIFVNYTFALSPDLSFLVHYHTLKFKGTIDAYFEFGDVFAFYAGGGTFYRFDIIDYETPSGVFRTDLPSALGATVMLGVEFNLNKEKTFSLGVVNALDMTFYSEMIIEYEILAQMVFKL